VCDYRRHPREQEDLRIEADSVTYDKDTNIVTATDRNPVVEECLHAEIMRWSFPASAEPVVVGSYPFTFDATLLRHRATRERPASPTARAR